MEEGGRVRCDFMHFSRGLLSGDVERESDDTIGALFVKQWIRENIALTGSIDKEEAGLAPG